MVGPSQKSKLNRGAVNQTAIIHPPLMTLQNSNVSILDNFKLFMWTCVMPVNLELLERSGWGQGSAAISALGELAQKVGLLQLISLPVCVWVFHVREGQCVACKYGP